MRKYWVRVGGKPFLDRRIWFICPLGGIFLTRIHAPDEGRDPHDHSRTFTSLILSGGYREDVYTDPDDLSRKVSRQHGLFSLHVMRREYAHQITSIREPLRTLVIAGRWRGISSFWTASGKISWKDYG
jgi:hypothetical protein